MPTYKVAKDGPTKAETLAGPGAFKRSGHFLWFSRKAQKLSRLDQISAHQSSSKIRNAHLLYMQLKVETKGCF